MTSAPARRNGTARDTTSPTRDPIAGSADGRAGDGADADAGPTPDQIERRGRIIAAACELAGSEGYDAVQMREVATTANVSLATIYRYFSSKDHLLAAAMTEWAGEMQTQVADVPPRGATAPDQLVDVIGRACHAMDRQPRLTAALIRALSSADPGVTASAERVQRQIDALASGILVDLDPELRADIMAVLGHVWYSTLVSWANDRIDMDDVIVEIERAARVLVAPHQVT